VVIRKDDRLLRLPHNKKSILLVGGDLVFRTGLTSILKKQGKAKVVGEAIDYANGLDMIRTIRCDLVIVYIGSRRVARGLKLIKSIRAEQPACHVLVVSARPESVYATRCLRAGARGYLTTEEATTDYIRKALRHISSSRIYLSPAKQQSVLGKYVDEISDIRTGIAHLTGRESEVMRLIGRGLDINQIAAQLRLSGITIRIYRKHLRQKLGFADRWDLAQYARHWVETIDLP
jgi:two-component system, NarL family, response regulator NreC